MKTIAAAPRPAQGSAPAALRLPPMRRRAGETVGELAYRRLRHAIMTGRFPPGCAVTIRGLAALLGTSAMPVREAMRRLVAEQALDLQDNRRARVPEMTGARFLHLIETRILLETTAARRALPAIDAARLAELQKLDRAVNEAFARNDIERTIESNLAFHRRLYGFAPHDVLTPLIDSIWLQVGPFMRAALRGAPAHYRIDRHDEALAAIEAGDERALVAAITADIRDGAGHLTAEDRLRAA